MEKNPKNQEALTRMLRELLMKELDYCVPIFIYKIVIT